MLLVKHDRDSGHTLQFTKRRGPILAGELESSGLNILYYDDESICKVSWPISFLSDLLREMLAMDIVL